MKLFKSILLGAATGMVGVAAASAADLPMRTKGPAVSYVRICDIYGAGFFYVPGSSDTCIKIQGFIRADYNFQGTHNILTRGTANVNTANTQSVDGFFARFGFGADVRTATEYGVLRANALGEFSTNNSGGFGGTASTFGNSANVRSAFIQFAGITAGRAESFFDFYGYGADYISVHDSYQPTNMIAYTATFGGGFSASLGLEDPQSRQNNILAATAGAGATTVGAGDLGANAVNAISGGTRVPDIVAALRVDQGWGSAQLSAAAHQSIAVSPNGNAPNASKSVEGYAVQAGVKILLPMLAAGDALWLEGAYADGATAYLGLGSFQTNSIGGAQEPGARLTRPEFDVAATNVGGLLRLQKQKGFQVMAALNHYYTPTVRQAFIIGYTKLDRNVNTFANYGIGQWSEFRVGTQVEWIPVAGFTLGVEAEYARVNETVNAADAANLAAAGLKSKYGTYIGKVRLQRSF